MPLMTYPRFKAFNPDTGDFLAAGQVFFYLAGTNTPHDVYADAGLTTPVATNSNGAVELDGSGEATIYLDPAIAYKVVLEDPYNTVIWTVDNVQAAQDGSFDNLTISGDASVAGALSCRSLAVTSSSEVANLNSAELEGKTWEAPGTIGSGTPNSGAFTALSASGNASVAGNSSVTGNETVGGTQDVTGDVTQHANRTQQTPNGGKCIEGQISEEITLSTSGTTTDSTTNLLPAHSEILGVIAYLTASITVATDWKMGDASTADRFTSANSNLAQGSTDVGLRQRQGGVTTDATGPVQTADAKLRITTTGTPGAGKVRVTVFYRQFIAPTS